MGNGDGSLGRTRFTAGLTEQRKPRSDACRCRSEPQLYVHRCQAGRRFPFETSHESSARSGPGGTFEGEIGSLASRAQVPGFVRWPPPASALPHRRATRRFPLTTPSAQLSGDGAGQPRGCALWRTEALAAREPRSSSAFAILATWFRIRCFQDLRSKEIVHAARNAAPHDGPAPPLETNGRVQGYWTSATDYRGMKHQTPPHSAESSMLGSPTMV